MSRGTRRKAYIAFLSKHTISITTPLFSKVFELSDKSIEAIDLISVKAYKNINNARKKSDFIAEIKYSKEYNFEVDLVIYARIDSEGGLASVGILGQEDQECVFEVNIIDDPNKTYFDYLENIDEVI